MTEIAEPLRRAAFGAAYRMLGSIADADDVRDGRIDVTPGRNAS